jgi:hypothetical protein
MAITATTIKIPTPIPYTFNNGTTLNEGILLTALVFLLFLFPWFYILNVNY